MEWARIEEALDRGVTPLVRAGVGSDTVWHGVVAVVTSSIDLEDDDDPDTDEVYSPRIEPFDGAEDPDVDLLSRRWPRGRIGGGEVLLADSRTARESSGGLHSATVTYVDLDSVSGSDGSSRLRHFRCAAFAVFSIELHLRSPLGKPFDYFADFADAHGGEFHGFDLADLPD